MQLSLLHPAPMLQQMYTHGPVGLKLSCVSGALQSRNYVKTISLLCLLHTQGRATVLLILSVML